VRLHFRRLVERNFPQLVVLSYNEIAAGVNIESLGMVSVEYEDQEV
jgi:flagellar biosynthesis component FlhA